MEENSQWKMLSYPIQIIFLRLLEKHDRENELEGLNKRCFHKGVIC